MREKSFASCNEKNHISFIKNWKGNGGEYFVIDLILLPNDVFLFKDFFIYDLKLLVGFRNSYYTRVINRVRLKLFATSLKQKFFFART